MDHQSLQGINFAQNIRRDSLSALSSLSLPSLILFSNAIISVFLGDCPGWDDGLGRPQEKVAGSLGSGGGVSRGLDDDGGGGAILPGGHPLLRLLLSAHALRRDRK